MHAATYWDRQLTVVAFDEDGNPFEDRRGDTGSYETDTKGSSMLPWWKNGIPDDITWMSAKP